MGSPPPPFARRDAVALVAVEMGYGHLRAAAALAAALGVEVLAVDRPPLAGAGEARRWARTRGAYERLSRASQLPVVGAPLRTLLDALTAVPNLYRVRDQGAPTAAVRALERMARDGLGDRLLAHLRRHEATLLTTFYAPAVIAELGGWERIVCVVTDADLNRVWVPRAAGRTRIHYCAPSERAVRRLRAYGVPDANVHLTGFPLPPSLVGAEDTELRRQLAGRLVRLDPRGTFRGQLGGELRHLLGPLPEEEQGRPPRLTFAVGGAGAQADLVRRFLPSLARPLAEGRLRLSLVAGTRGAVAERLHAELAAAGLSGLEDGVVEVLVDPTIEGYLRRFDALMARTDILWTKPSELTFYAALGIPLVFAWPVGAHERLNRRWAIERGAGIKQDDPAHAWGWLEDCLEDGTLAAAAWSGYVRLPRFGTDRILEVVRAVQAAR